MQREQAAGISTAEVCRRRGISEQAFYRWKRTRKSSKPWKTKPAAEEAAGRVEAGRAGADDLLGKLIGPAARRDAALRLLAERGFSLRRACWVVRIDPTTVRRTSEPGDAERRERPRRLAAERRRFGYRRLGVLRQREGVSMNKKKLFRLYKDEGLAVRRRRGRESATGTPAPMALLDRPNQRWSLDFVTDALSWGRRFRILAVVDDFTCEALALVVDISIGGGGWSGNSTPSSRPATSRRRSSATTGPR